MERGLVVPDLLMIYKISQRFNVGVDELLNVKAQPRKSLSRISAENQLIERIRTMDDHMLDFVVDQLNVVIKHFKE